MMTAELTVEQVAERILAEIKRAAPLVGAARVMSLADFVRKSWHILEPNRVLVWNWHMDAICQHLEACVFGYLDSEGVLRALRNLAIIIPPGTSKSHILSVCFPAWVWLHDASRRFLYITNSHANATRDSMKCRRILESDWYRDLIDGEWGLTQGTWDITEDQNAKDWFETTKGGHRQCLGVGSDVTGKKGDFVIVDDANDAESVNSEAERRRVNDKFANAISDRGNDFRTDVYIVCGQRTHENDLIGFILKKYSGWEKLFLPEELQMHKRSRTCIGWIDPRTVHGELLRPRQFTRERAETMKRDNYRGYRTKHILDPINEQGNRFKSANFRYWYRDGDYIVLPCKVRGEYRCTESQLLLRFGVADGAASAKRSADFTVVSGFGVTPRYDLVWLGMSRFQAEIPEQPKMLENAMRSMRLAFCIVEAVAGNRALFQLSARAAVNVRQGSPKSKDKLSRAVPALVLTEAHRLFLPDAGESPGTDIEAIISELLAFTGDEKIDAHDDIVDTLSYAVEFLFREYPTDRPSGPSGPVAATKINDLYGRQAEAPQIPARKMNPPKGIVFPLLNQQ